MNVFGERAWHAEELNGQLHENGDKSMGNRYHLHSYHKNTKIEVQLNGSSLQILVKEVNGGILQTYTSDLMELDSWGPIVAPYENGANITWWTKAAVKTKACVEGILYFGNNNMSQTQTNPHCEMDPDVLGTNYHSIFIDKIKFNGFVNSKEIDFDNTPKEHVKFLVTSDAHDNTEIIKLAIQNISEFDFHVNGGDQTSQLIPTPAYLDLEQYKAYEYWH